MKSKSIIFFCIVLYSLNILSCSKQEINHNTTENELSIIIKTLFKYNDADFNILTSSSFGNSLYTTNLISNTSTIIQANEKNGKNVGIFKVNENIIPFEKDINYSRQSDEEFKTIDLIGRYNDYTIEALNQSWIKSFKHKLYSPYSTIISFSGIYDYQLPRKNDLTIHWKNDNNNDANIKTIITVFAEDDNGNNELLYKIPQPNDTSILLSSYDLSKFDNYKKIQIKLAKGYDTLLKSGDKMVHYKFINYSHSTINFSN